MKKNLKYRIWNGNKILNITSFDYDYKGLIKNFMVEGIETKFSIESFIKKYSIGIITKSIGIFDINGNEIFEGDLIKYSGNSRFWSVYFDPKKNEFRIRCKSLIGEYYDYSLIGLKIEIRGNEFENRELVNK